MLQACPPTARKQPLIPSASLFPAMGSDTGSLMDFLVGPRRSKSTPRPCAPGERITGKEPPGITVPRPTRIARTARRPPLRVGLRRPQVHMRIPCKVSAMSPQYLCKLPANRPQILHEGLKQPLPCITSQAFGGNGPYSRIACDVMQVPSARPPINTRIRHPHFIPSPRNALTKHPHNPSPQSREHKNTHRNYFGGCYLCQM